MAAGWLVAATGRQYHMIFQRNVHLKDAHKTPQFWRIWWVLCLNASNSFSLLGIALYALAPIAASGRSCCSLFYQIYGGGFVTGPAYLADKFGTKFAGAIHGRLLTAWSGRGQLSQGEFQLLSPCLSSDHLACGSAGRRSGAQLLAGEGDKPLIEGGYYPGQETTAELKFPPVKVDRSVKEGDTVSIGNVTLTAHATPGHTPGCTSWTMNVQDGTATHSVIIFCSATIALNKLVSNPTYPGIIDDYRKTFAWARDATADVFLAPHPEMYGMEEKRAKIAQGAPNPFVKPGEFNTYVAGLEKAFDAGLAKQTAEASPSKN
jgi:hypothetical protein